MPPVLSRSVRSLRVSPATLALALLACGAGQAQAGSNELQVYRDDMPDKGEYNLEFSTGLLKHAASSELKGVRQLSALAELSYGYSDEWEAGVKLPVYQIHQQWHASGLTAEVRYIATHQQQGWYWGAELELGYQSPYHEQRQWLLELTPIIGYRLGNWHFTANPGMALASRGDEQGELMFEPSAKLNWRIS